MVRGGNTIEVELKSFVNSEFALTTDSFSILTMTSEGYLIDEQQEGIGFSSNCNYPCLQCSENDPSVCRKCNTEPDSPGRGAQFQLLKNNTMPQYLYFEGILDGNYDRTCISECPSNYFPLNNICSQCDPGCLECEETSKKCLKCHAGQYLLGNTCMDVCPPTHHGIDEDGNGTCELCERPCETCSGSLTHCTSCDSAHPQYLFFENRCYETCPTDASVFDEGQCIACSDNCGTCADSPFNCTSCTGDQYLDQWSLRCMDTCPVEISVATYTPYTDADLVKQELTCEMCHENCLTCSEEDTAICTECREGLKMVERTKECVKACPVGTADIWIPLTEDVICAECAPGCSECMYDRDHCTACEDGLKFFDFTCVQECPEGFGVASPDKFIAELSSI